MTQTRWQQRFENYQKALQRLTSAVELAKTRELSDLENQGLIQAFEFTYELSWNVIKDFYREQGDTDIQGSRDAFRLAFQRGLVDKGDIWMEMIKSRMLSSHTYNEETAKQVSDSIKNQYHAAFRALSESLTDKLNIDTGETHLVLIPSPLMGEG